MADAALLEGTESYMSAAFKIRTGSSPVLATNKFYKNYVDSTLLAPDVS